MGQDTPRLRELTDRAVRGSTILLRVDHNLPLTASGEVSDDMRLVRTLPTIEHLVSCGSRVVVLSHWGYPGGRRDGRVSTARLAGRLAEYIPRSIRFCPSAEPDVMKAHVAALKTSELLYVENVRFLSGEERNDPELAKGWSELADVYVSEAFSVSHRRQASVAALPDRMPAFAGRDFVHERRQLARVLDGPRPRALVLGGAKVEQKLSYLPALAGHFDVISLGGLCAVHAATALGHFAALGQSWLSSVATESLVDLPATLFVPHDWRVLDDGRHVIVKSQHVTDPTSIVDIGPSSAERLVSLLAGCRTIFWNGPLGRYEEAAARGATATLATGLAQLGSVGVHTAVGGGDTVAALKAIGMTAAIGFISAAGGAALAYLVHGDELPGIRPLVGARLPAEERL